MLGYAEFEDLTAIFGLPHDLSRKIMNSPSRFIGISLASYLSPEERSVLRKRFANLSQSQLDAFWQSKRSAAAVLTDQLRASLSQKQSELLDKVLRLAGIPRPREREEQTYISRATSRTSRRRVV